MARGQPLLGFLGREPALGQRRREVCRDRLAVGVGRSDRWCVVMFCHITMMR
jgi:hypothetical protein